MFVQAFDNVRFISNSAQVKLPRPNLILDPRLCYPINVRVHCHYHDDGITVTITITITTDDVISFEEWGGDVYSFGMRVYDPAHETIPDFDSTIYTYMGHDREVAPAHTTIGIVDRSVKTIKYEAFDRCWMMKKCIIYGGVETIETAAFCDCESLEALFLPSSIEKIDRWAFLGCTNIRILSIPIDIDISQVGKDIIYSCDTFFRIAQIPQYEFHDIIQLDAINDGQVHQAIIEFYRNLPPLHRACLDVNVSVQTIHNCIVTHGSRAASITDHDGMTPLHILSLNPHATLGSIQECFDADTCTVFVGDGRGNTPLDYLMEHHLDGHTWIVTSLCMHREAYSSSVSNNGGDKTSTNKNKRKRIN